MSVLKKLLGQTLTYGFSTIVVRLIGYLLVPLYTAVFQVGEFGVQSLLYSYIAFLNVLFTYGMETAFFRFATRDGEDQQKVFNLAQTAVIFTSLTLASIIAIFSQPLARLLDYPDQWPLVLMMAGILALDAIVALPFAKLRLENKPKYFVAVRTANVVINVGLNIFFLIICREIYLGETLPDLRPVIGHIYDPSIGIGYIFISNIIASAITLPLLLPAFKGFDFTVNWSRFRPMLVYAIPIMFTGLAGMVNEMIDRTLLMYWLPTDLYPDLAPADVVGIYSACYKLSIFMTLAVTAFRFAAEPFFFSLATEQDAKEKYALVMHWFVIVCASIFLLVSLNLGSLEHLLRDDDYRLGISVVPVLLLANLCLGVYYNLTIWFKLNDRTRVGTYISFFGAAVTLIANLLLIPYLGFMGSAIATLICYAAMAAVCYILGQVHFPVPYRIREIFIYVAVAVVLYYGTLWLEMPEHGFWIMAYNIPFLVFILIVYLREREGLRALRS